jgi:outer membrane protein assembly factor BamB
MEPRDRRASRRRAVDRRALLGTLAAGVAGLAGCAGRDPATNATDGVGGTGSPTSDPTPTPDPTTPEPAPDPRLALAAEDGRLRVAHEAGPAVASDRLRVVVDGTVAVEDGRLGPGHAGDASDWRDGVEVGDVLSLSLAADGPVTARSTVRVVWAPTGESLAERAPPAASVEGRWPAPAEVARNTSRGTAAGPTAPVERAWDRETDAWVTTAVAADGVAYLGSETTGGRVLAVDAGTGDPLWTAGAVSGVAGLALEGDRLYVTSVGGRLSALVAATGQRLWRRDLGDPFPTAPTVADGRVYVGTDAGLAVCGTDGESRYERALGRVGGRPAVADLEHVAAMDGTVHAFEPGPGGERVWESAVADSLSAAPVVADGRVYAGGIPGLTALSAATGERLWRRLTDRAVDAAPAVVDGVAYGGNRGVAAVGPDGRVRWERSFSGSTNGTSVVAGGERLYVAEPGGAVRALTREGEALFREPTVGTPAPPAVLEGWLVGGDSTGAFGLRTDE